MAQAIRRLGYKIVGQRVVYNDRPVSWASADKLAGRRLDRRKNRAINGDQCGCRTM